MIANHGPAEVQTGMRTVFPAPPEVGTSFKACLKFWPADRLSKETPGSEGFHTFISAHRNLETLTTDPSLGEIRALAERLRNARTPLVNNAIAIEARKDMSAFLRSCDPMAQHRRLYLTEDRHLGLGPQSAEAGDEIWLVDGAQVPFVLRPVDMSKRTFILVRETYLHGFMNGEMLDWKEVGEEERNVIV